jgi:hypothetical protein
VLHNADLRTSAQTSPIAACRTITPPLMRARAAPAGSPPDVFESAATPRGGRGIEQRLIVTFGTGGRPPGFASNTPRARLAPAADAFVARRLGALGGIRVRLLDARGVQIAAPTLASLGLSALDIAALDLSTENVMVSNLGSPTTMPGAPNSNPGRQGVARLLLAAGHASAATVGFDLSSTPTFSICSITPPPGSRRSPAEGRCRPTRSSRAQLAAPSDASGLAAIVASLAQELSVASPPY